jgi:hypothetical protein
MRYDEQRRPPLWVVQGDDIYGRDLSPVERALELVDEQPSSRAGLDTTCRPQQRTRPSAASLPSLAAEGPDFPSAA